MSDAAARPLVRRLRRPARAVLLVAWLAACARADGRVPPSAVTLPGSPVPGAGTGGVTGVVYYAAAVLAHVEDSLAGTPRTGHVLRRDATMQLIALRRGADGAPEVHQRWSDVAVVQAGRATLLYGGHVEGGRAESPGELRGGRIVGGTRRAVAPGDVIVIPAGTPHQYLLTRGDSLRYLTTKVIAAH